MGKNRYLLGYDIGSSSIKASLIDIQTQNLVACATSPQKEMDIVSLRPGWAEQDPALWWAQVKTATEMLRRDSSVNLSDVQAIGISYQMHGLVMVGKDHSPLSNAIIWCDSRAVDIGNQSFSELGDSYCRKHLLNSPGNFTASKLAWVKKNQPDIYGSIHAVMLPGDFIAMKFTGEIQTTPSGLSEGMMWDFANHKRSDFILDYFGFDHRFIPGIVPCFSVQGIVRDAVADELGFSRGVVVSYRAGDQPNNALSLNVLEPGEIAATAGTSGVVYGVSDEPVCDKDFRVNTFAHVNYTPQDPRYGVLLCINGTGICNRWVRDNFCTVGNTALSYERMNAEAQQIPAGSDGLFVLPFGNGAERTLRNRNVYASFSGLDFSRHSRAHVLRALQEGIVFALRHGLDIMQNGGVAVKKIRAGNANMFKSDLFAEVFATVCNAELELYDTDGSQGAARAAGIGCGVYRDAAEAFKNLRIIRTVRPDVRQTARYEERFTEWSNAVKKSMSNAQAAEDSVQGSAETKLIIAKNNVMAFT